MESDGLYAPLVERERHDLAARHAVENEPGPFVLSPFVLCEVDYLLVTGAGEALILLPAG